MNKLRHGQEITSEILNNIIEEVNSLKEQHDKANMNKSETEKQLALFSSTLGEIESQYKIKLSAIPNFLELMDTFLKEYNGGVQWVDKANQTNSSPILATAKTRLIICKNTSQDIELKDKTLLFNIDTHVLSLFYNGTTYNFSTDASGNPVTTTQLSQAITIDPDTGHWLVEGVDTGKSAIGPQGLTGPRGADGAQGPQGIRGEQGMTGPQGLQGNNGKTPKVLYGCADDAFGTNFIQGQYVDGKHFIALKFVYNESSESEIAATPWNYIRVMGEVYYPHIRDGKLYFDRTYPTAETTDAIEVRGPKGDKGDEGPSPYIAFDKSLPTTPADYDGREFITPDRSIESSPDEDGHTHTTHVFDANCFKGDKGDTGEAGPQGVKGEKGDSGEPPVFLPQYSSVEYKDGITVPEITTASYAGGYAGINLKLPKPKQGTQITIENQTTDMSDLDTYPNGARKITFKLDNGVDEPQFKEVFVPLSASPKIGADGYWYVNGISTGVKAQGEKGEDGADAVSLTIKGACYVAQGTITVGTAYPIYSDSEHTQNITATDAGDCYLSNGYLFVASGAGSTSFICAGNIKGEDGADGAPGANGQRGTGIFFLNDTKANKVNTTVDPQYVAGDIAITNDFYLLKAITDGATIKWSSLEQNIKGPQGTQGANGTDGETPVPTGVSFVTNNDVAHCLQLTFSVGEQTVTVKTSESAKGSDGKSVGSVTLTSTEYNQTPPGQDYTTTKRTYTVRDTNDASLGTFVVYDGKRGNDGTNGINGQDGHDGDPGEDGADGQDGKSILLINNSRSASLNTPVASNVKVGDLGLTTDSFVLICSSAMKWTDPSTGQLSFKGRDGNKLFTYSTPSSGAPTSSSGLGTTQEGDLAYNTNTYTLYKKVGTNWSSIGSLKGPKGDTGPVGPAGPQGDSKIPTPTESQCILVSAFSSSSGHYTKWVDPTTTWKNKYYLNSGQNIFYWAKDTTAGNYANATFVRDNAGNIFDDASSYFEVSRMKFGYACILCIELKTGIKRDDQWIKIDTSKLGMTNIANVQVTHRDYQLANSPTRFASIHSGTSVYVGTSSDAGINQGFYLTIYGYSNETY